MADQDKVKIVEQLTGLRRIAKELHDKFSQKYCGSNPGFFRSIPTPSCNFRLTDSAWDDSRSDNGYWLKRATEINDIVREELAR